MPAFDDTDKERIRYHLRYPQVDIAIMMTAGVLFAGEVQFVLEKAMDHVFAQTIPRVQKILSIMDSIEDQMVDAHERLSVTKADIVTFNSNEHGDLESSYCRWQNKLSEILSVPVNPNTPNGNGLRGLNVRVRN